MWGKSGPSCPPFSTERSYEPICKGSKKSKSIKEEQSEVPLAPYPDQLDWDNGAPTWSTLSTSGSGPWVVTIIFLFLKQWSFSGPCPILLVENNLKAVTSDPFKGQILLFGETYNILVFFRATFPYLEENPRPEFSSAYPIQVLCLL